MKNVVKILGIAGSLRKGSYSKAVLRAAKELSPEGCEIEIFDLEGIPLFNQDLEKEMPGRVKELKNKVGNADAILIVVPEQNHAVSAVLKNALEWGSRPGGYNSFDDKPAAIISVSTGMLGGVRAERNLRQIFVDLNMYPINKPRLYVNFAHEKINEKGRLTDKETRKQIKPILSKLVEWTMKLK